MTNPEILQSIAIGTVFCGWAGKFVYGLLHRDRAALDKADSAMEAQAKTIWTKVDKMKEEVEELRRLTAVLEDRIEALPDFERWDAKLENIRARLEDKLDKVSDQINETLVVFAKKSGSQA
jgi:predicted nuclease with TOPRIM domain